MEIGGYCARQAEQSFCNCGVETQFINLYYFNPISSMIISGKLGAGARHFQHLKKESNGTDLKFKFPKARPSLPFDLNFTK